MRFSATRRSRRSNSAPARNSNMSRSCSAASSRPPTTSRLPKRSPASRTSASFTRWRPSGSSQRFGVKPYTWNPFFPVNTLNLMRAAVAAQFEGVFEKYIEAAFHHMWVEPKKMDDPEVAIKAPDSIRPRCGKAVRPRAGSRRQGEADRKHPIRCRARRVRLADLLRRQGDVFRQGAAARGRGIGFGEVNRAVIASEAKQSIPPFDSAVDCFVASLLAMTRHGEHQCRNATQPPR